MSAVLSLTFNQIGLAEHLASLDVEQMDALDFGLIGFDAETVVTAYNECEAQCAGLAKQRTLGRPLFTNVAHCMNNYLVAQRFEDALAEGHTLDATIDYVLTLRMRPVKVKLRLLALPHLATRYVLVQRPV